MSKKLLIAIVLFLALFISFNSVNAVTRTKLIDSSDASIVTYGSSANSKYAYGFRVNNNTKIVETNANNYNMKYYNLDLDHNILTFIPADNEGSGKVYAYVEDFGMFNGKQVDLKMTFTYKTYDVDGTTVYPVIRLHADKLNGTLKHFFLTTAYEVTYEILSDGKPLNMDLSLLLGDIDYAQYFAIKTANGTVNSIQTVPDSMIYYEKSNGYNWVFDTTYTDAPENESAEARRYTARFEIASTNKFSIIIGAERDIYSYSSIFTAPILEAVSISTGLPLYTEDTLKDSILTANTKILNSDFTSLGMLTFQAAAYGPYVNPKPLLFIQDYDKKLKEETILKELDDEVIYYGFTQVPLESHDFYYNTFDYTVELPNEVKVNDVKVYNESNEDVTNNFVITNDGNKYNFAAKSNVVTQDSFYNDTYIYVFKTDLTQDAKSKAEEKGSIEFTAISNLRITRSGGEEENASNTVNTTYALKNTYKIITEVVNGTIDGNVDVVQNGEDITINYEANKGYIISKIIIDGEEIEINGYKTSYTFKGVDKDHSIKVIYEIENPNTGAYIGLSIIGISLLGVFSYIILKKNKKKFYHI